MEPLEKAQNPGQDSRSIDKMETNDQSFDSAQENINPLVQTPRQSPAEIPTELKNKPLEHKTLAISAPMAHEVLGRVKQTQSAVYQLGKAHQATSDAVLEELVILSDRSAALTARSSQSDALVRDLSRQSRYLYSKAHFLQLANINHMEEVQALSKELLHRDKPLEIKLSLVTRWGHANLVAARLAARVSYSTYESLSSFQMHSVYARKIRSSSSIPKTLEAERHWISEQLAIQQEMSLWFNGNERSIELSSNIPFHTVCVELVCPCINSLTPIEASHTDPLDCKTRRLAQEIMIALQHFLQSASFERLETLKVNYIPNETPI